MVNYSHQDSYSNGLGYNRMSSHAAGADMFFHVPQPPLPPPTPSTFTPATAPLTPAIQQPSSQQPRLDDFLGFPNSVNKDGPRAFGMPCHQTTSQQSPKEVPNAIPSTPTILVQQDDLPNTEQMEEQEDTEMESIDYSSIAASRSTTTSTSKGLANSMWNPANRSARADSVGSSRVRST